ncbi:MAG TPA: tRNA glutamyl-Q(34) synthetase GluQRS [Gammaproteobacteria bacterium]|nr:tRNA glutamyl-Q(34) synthetase GluQRS [Gammaproteobacteria bacterium]
MVTEPSAPDSLSAYTGRFAPSPTGPLHFGSLIAALGSYLDARAHGGAWLLRMEDLDPPRELPGAGDAILRTLDTFGLHWDGPVLYQHTRLDAYRSGMTQLLENGDAFPCACTRSEIADSGLSGIESPVYPGTCRNGPGDRPARTVRVRVNEAPLGFEDSLQGSCNQNLQREIGDFVIRRADGHFAYQLAVVVDDAFQGITHVVRGADLLLSTPRQIHLQRLLRFATPIYMHLPVAVNAAGEKLSKQTGAEPLHDAEPGADLFRALTFLSQTPPAELNGATPHELLDWAVSHWQPARMTGIRTRAIG